MTRYQMRALLMCFLAAACDSGKPPVTPSNDSQAIDKPIDGYGGLKLGANFEDVIASVDTSDFYSGSVGDCIRDLAVQGCQLFSTHESVYAIKEGIPYSLDLEFNRFGKLVQIGLGYERRGDIDAAACREIFGRTADWVAADFGHLNYRESSAAADEKYLWDKTPKGVRYFYTDPSATGSFVTSFLRSASIREESRSTSEGQRWVALNRHLYLLGTYIVTDGNPTCGVDLRIREPDTVPGAALQAVSE
ncbi:hypothetical protein [Sphingobium abikonense]|uniref:hypothetical protein n=1 Tax=Sphingobium abikonense TaxID=86193 RepID=UPI00351652C0